jgi:serine/threonine protein kinase
MPTNGTCPPVRDLQRLVRMQLDHREALAMRQHVDQCPRCLEILHTFEEELSPPSVPGLKVWDPNVESSTWERGRKPATPLPEARPVRKTAPVPVGKTTSGQVPVVRGAAPRGGAAQTAVDTGPSANGQTPLPPGSATPAPTVIGQPPLHRNSAESTEEVLSLVGPAAGPDELGRLGPYRLLRVLGSGATGVVFLAEDIHLKRQVALKVMKPVPEAGDIPRQRFLREAQAAAVLDHENVISIYQVGEDRGIPFLAMKLLQGESLDDRLKREPGSQLLVHEVLRIGREIAEGLDAAHERGLIHRDIKPANIFLEGPQARVKIVDFGLARALSDDVHLTRTGTIVGTPAYMSPEQARGLPVDHRSDLFSLGCVLYRMCTGRTPFKADDTFGMLTALAQDQPRPIQAFNSAVPDALVGLICRLLAKVPEGRPQSARSVAAALAKMANQAAAAQTRGDASWSPPSPSDRPWWVTMLQMVTLAAVSWAVYWYGPTLVQAARTQVSNLIEEWSQSRGRS